MLSTQQYTLTSLNLADVGKPCLARDQSVVPKVRGYVTPIYRQIVRFQQQALIHSGADHSNPTDSGYEAWHGTGWVSEHRHALIPAMYQQPNVSPPVLVNEMATASFPYTARLAPIDYNIP
jgi:hypothetical protein